MIIALVGPSSSGKDTIAKELCKRYQYTPVVSYTTRPMREKEVDGEDYHFVSLGMFYEMKEQGIFAETDRYSGCRYYGSQKEDYLQKGKDTVAVLTPNGVRQLRKDPEIRKELIVVYINCSLLTRCQRYINRIKGTFSIDDLIELMRRSIADEEMFRSFEDYDMKISNEEGTSIAGYAVIINQEARKLYEERRRNKAD